MKKTYKLNFIVLMSFIFFFAGCEKEDYTGFSTLEPTSPSITITGIAASGYNFVEQDTTFTFDVTLSTPQVADVVIYIKQIDGDATAGEDYKINNTGAKVNIGATETTGQVSISILPDEMYEGVETVTLQIGDERTANADLTPATVTFTIGNATKDILVAGMSWATDAATVLGITDIEDTEAADLRMLIVDMNDNSIVAVADGASFEEYASFDTLADGNYMIAADFYATANAGDFNETVTVDVTLEFNQAGVINHQMMQFPAVMTNSTPCSTYRTNLAIVTKAGANFSFEEAVSASWEVDLASLAGMWVGEDGSTTVTTEASTVVTTFTDPDLTVAGLGHGWMFNFWGEEVLDSLSGTVNMEFDWTNHGAVSISEQYYITTLYDGAEYPYTIIGSGTFNTCGDAPALVFEYDMIQEGFSTAGWCAANGYLTTELFVADIKLSPGGKWMTPQSGHKKKANINKPY